MSGGAAVFVTAENLETVNEILRQLCLTVNIVVISQRLLEAQDPEERVKLSKTLLNLVQSQHRAVAQLQPQEMPDDDDDDFGQYPNRRW